MPGSAHTFNLPLSEPHGDVRSVVLVLAGLRAAPSEWRPLAEKLRPHGVALQALPLWGQAGHHAAGPRAFDAWPEDGCPTSIVDDAVARLRAAAREAHARFGQVRLALAGHSFGAYVAVRALEHPELPPSLREAVLWLINPTIAPRKQLRGAARAAVLVPDGCKLFQHVFGRVSALWKLWPMIQPLPAGIDRATAALTHSAYRAVHPGTYRVLADAPPVEDIPAHAHVALHPTDSIVDPAHTIEALARRGTAPLLLEQGDHNPHQDARGVEALTRQLLAALDRGR